ncbi:MAG: AbrB/MazE/SpoVT family DNA-binding domain-containing protein [Candidatus Heimdallarchaeota archaeon]
MNDKEPKIVFRRKVIYSSGTFRIAIPLEIIEALNIKKGDEVLCYLEGSKKIVFEFT